MEHWHVTSRTSFTARCGSWRARRSGLRYPDYGPVRSFGRYLREVSLVAWVCFWVTWNHVGTTRCRYSSGSASTTRQLSTARSAPRDGRIRMPYVMPGKLDALAV